jgi:hypothetical protein
MKSALITGGRTNKFREHRPGSAHSDVGMAFAEEGAVSVRGASHLWVMPRDDVISEAPDRIHVPPRREKLEGADSDVARCDSSQ